MKRSLAAASISAILAAPAVSADQYFNLTTGVDFSTWSLRGSAAVAVFPGPPGFVDNYLRLTTHFVGGEAGAAYAPMPAVINFNDAFQFDFRFFVAHGDTAQGDGLTFFMTGDTPVLGGGGSDLGYGGSGMGGYAFAVDTFSFGGDPMAGGEPAAVSVQILGGGSVTPLAYTETGLADIQPADYFQWTGTVRYTPSGLIDEQGALEFSIWQGFTNQTYTVNLASADWSSVGEAVFDGDTYLGRSINFGFTAGTGLADDGHFVGSLLPVPEAETWVMLLAGLGLVGVGGRLRRAWA